MGLFDMLNTDSVVDLIIGMGAPKSKIIMSMPASAYKFDLKNESENMPRSPTKNEQPVALDRKKVRKYNLIELRPERSPCNHLSPLDYVPYPVAFNMKTIRNKIKSISSNYSIIFVLFFKTFYFNSIFFVILQFFFTFASEEQSLNSIFLRWRKNELTLLYI